MGSWNPEEHYIWIEPNVKYLLHSPNAYKTAPLPWYERPPPEPYKPLPKDKLRSLSTRRINNAFDFDTPWVQTVADDLDSFSQTFLTALLARGGKDTKSISGMYARLGTHTAHYLCQYREESREMFWRSTERLKRNAQRQKVREEKGQGMEGGAEDAKEEVQGIDVMAQSLYELLDLNSTQLWKETLLARSGRQEEERDRTDEQYRNYIKAMEKVQVAAETMVQRKKLRKEEQEKKAEEERRKAIEEKKGEAIIVEEERMEVEGRAESSNNGRKVDDTSEGDANDVTPVATRSVSVYEDVEQSDEDVPPKKRIRTE